MSHERSGKPTQTPKQRQVLVQPCLLAEFGMSQSRSALPPFHGAAVGTFLGLSRSSGAQPVGMGGKHSAAP